MKQVVRKGLKEIIVDEVPDPVVTPHHVLVRPIYSLISSGTETASIHKEGLLKEVAENPAHLRKIWEVVKQNGPIGTAREVFAKFSEYAVLGYSGAGFVVDRHPTVKDLKLGDRVAYGGEGTGHAETILVGRNLVARVPDGVSFDRACFATLGSIALNSVRIGEVGLGETVAIIGLGLVGQLVAQLARLQGGITFVTDLQVDRVNLARRLGADYVLEGGGASPAEAVRALTNGKGADCVIIAAAANSDAPCRLALDMCRDRGRIVVTGAVELNFPWPEMYAKEVQLFMSRAYGPGSYDPSYERDARDYPYAYVRWTENRNMEEFLRLVDCGRVQLDELVTHRFPLEDAARAYETIMDPAIPSLAVLLHYPAALEPEPSLSFTPKRKIESSSRAALERNTEWNFALVGASNIARWAHLPALKKTERARLRAVVSSSGVRGKNYARRFGAEYCSSDYAEILRDESVHAVLITTRNQSHATEALAALEAGKHVFVEKPMALTEEECRALTHKVQETGRTLTVGFNRRFAPFYVELKKRLADRKGPAVINCRVNSPGISGTYWMADRAIGGAILGEAVHFIDLMYWLLDSEPVRVSAFSLPLHAAEPVGDNNVAASFRFEDGSVGNLTYCTIGSKSSGGERVEIFAQGIGLITENFKHLMIKRGLASKRSQWWADKGYDGQMRSFVEALRTGADPAVTVVDGARATLGCLALLESARSGQPREIDLQSVLVG